MILYFADRHLNVLGLLGDKINRTSEITSDSFETDLESGIETLTVDIEYETSERKRIEKLCNVGNYVLCYLGTEETYKAFTIIDSEENTGENTMHIYAEDAGLDLINDMVGPYNVEKATYESSPNYASKWKWKGYYNKGEWIENNQYKATDYIEIPENSGGEYLVRTIKTSEYDTANPSSPNYASSSYIAWNGYYTQAGVWVEDDAYRSTNYIPIGPEISYFGFRISKDHEDDTNRWYGVYFFDANKRFLSCAKYEYLTKEVDTTWVSRNDNAEYILLSFAPEITELLMFQYDDFCYEARTNYVSNYKWKGYYTNSGKWYDNNNYRSTDYIPLDDADESYAIRTIQKSDTQDSLWYAEVYFDKNKKFLETTYRYNQQGTLVETSRRPYDAKYMIISFDAKLIDVRYIPIRPSKWFGIVYFDENKHYLDQHEYYSTDEETSKNIFAPVTKGAKYMILSFHRIFYDVRLVPSTVKLKPISEYMLSVIQDSGFSVGSNEFTESEKRAIAFYNTETATERIRDIVTEFEAEFSFSYKIENLAIVGKYINLYKSRGYNNGVRLRLGKEITNIRISKSVSNLATAILAVGIHEDSQGNTENLYLDRYEGSVDTANGYFIDGNTLYSRKAYEKWSRFTINGKEPGHIVKKLEYEQCKSRQDLYERALKDLKILENASVQYEVSLGEIPDSVKLGDIVYIVDGNGELHDPARITNIRRSFTSDSIEITVGALLSSVDGSSGTASGSASYSGGGSSSGSSSSGGDSSITGTNNYDLLANRPLINDVILTGNKKGSDLMLVQADDDITFQEIDAIVFGGLG